MYGKTIDEESLQRYVEKGEIVIENASNRVGIVMSWAKGGSPIDYRTDITWYSVPEDTLRWIINLLLDISVDNFREINEQIAERLIKNESVDEEEKDRDYRTVAGLFSMDMKSSATPSEPSGLGILSSAFEPIASAFVPIASAFEPIASAFEATASSFEAIFSELIMPTSFKTR